MHVPSLPFSFSPNTEKIYCVREGRKFGSFSFPSSPSVEKSRYSEYSTTFAIKMKMSGGSLFFPGESDRLLPPTYLLPYREEEEQFPLPPLFQFDQEKKRRIRSLGAVKKEPQFLARPETHFPSDPAHARSKSGSSPPLPQR